jgi:ribosomal protein S19
MARAKWKLKYFSLNIWKSLLNTQVHKKKAKTLVFSRATTVPGALVNSYIYIHKGLYFRKLLVMKKYVGKKVSALTFTKKPFNYPLTQKKEKHSGRR